MQSFPLCWMLFGIVTLIAQTDGESLTWNQPPPKQTVEAVGHTLHHSSSTELYKGTINANLTWQFDLIKLNFVSLTIFFNGTAIAGVTSFGSGPEPGFENQFDIDWIPNQSFVRLIIFNVTTEKNGTFTCKVAVRKMTGFASFQFESNLQVDVVAPPSNIAISSDPNCSADEKLKPTILTRVFDGTVVTTPLDVQGLAGYVPYIIGSVVAVLLVFIVVLIWWMKYRKPRKTHSDEERGDNGGADKQGQRAYAQFGPPEANGADGAAAQEVEKTAAIPNYAFVDQPKKKKEREEVPTVHTEVDKSKKKKTLDEPKKEKKPGELLYAGLGDFHNSGMPTVSISPQPQPSIKRADPHERTDYADITQFYRGYATLTPSNGNGDMEMKPRRPSKKNAHQFR